jgi:hypothetical protein
MGNHRTSVSRCSIYISLFGITEMNERIRELAMLANIEFTYDPTEIPPRAFAECWEDELGKFAELIVEECAIACEKNSYLALNGWQRAKQIREHFGVEE